MKTNNQKGSVLSIVEILVVVILIVVGGVYYITNKSAVYIPENPNGVSDVPTNPVACTMEAKMCPDGSYVGRVGPNCEFKACPSADSTSNWKTYTDIKYGFTFQYPDGWTVNNQSYTYNGIQARMVDISSPVINNFPGYENRPVFFHIQFVNPDQEKMIYDNSGYELVEYSNGGPVPIQKDATFLKSQKEPVLALHIKNSFKDLLIY